MIIKDMDPVNGIWPGVTPGFPDEFKRFDQIL